MPYLSLGRDGAKRPDKSGVDVAIVTSTAPSLNLMTLQLHDAIVGGTEASTDATRWLDLPAHAIHGSIAGDSAKKVTAADLLPLQDLREVDAPLASLKPMDRVKMLMQLSEMVEEGADAAELPAGPYRDVFAKLKDAAGHARPAVRVCLPPSASFQLAPTPHEDKRNLLMVSGAQGCGKSYFCAAWLRVYHKMWPDRPIYFISAIDIVKDDPAFSDLASVLVRIPIESLPIADTTKLGRCAVLVDDVDSLPKKVYERIDALQRDVINLNRKYGTSMIITSHKMTEGHRTAHLLANVEWAVVFPATCRADALRYYCCEKLGLSLDDLAVVRRLGRAVAIKLTSPMCAVGSDAACLLT